LAPDQEARETSDSPRTLEVRSGKGTEIVRLVVARIEDNEIGRIAVILGKGTIEHGSDIGFTRCINTQMLGASAFSNNCPRDVLDLIIPTPGNDDVATFARETTGKRGAEAAFRANPDHQCLGLTFRHLCNPWARK